MKKVKIGVLGVFRGKSMIRYCACAENAEVVAICDKNETWLNNTKEEMGLDSVTYYTSFDEFLKHDMDAVVLANYANEHAPFAVRCMEAGKHVFSEVLPMQTMKEAVQLVEAVERTGKIYAYGENYCYMPAPREMRKLYREGVIGEFEYGEGEYVHNCEPIWPQITYGEPDHWRNNMYANFYCTHSIGPLIHITGLRPVKVTGFEGTKIERNLRTGAKSGSFGIEMIELENGGIIKSIHGGLYRDSIWYSVYGAKGRLESRREDEDKEGVSTIHVNADSYSGEYGELNVKTYQPTDELSEKGKAFGHGGSDFYSMYHFVEKIRGNKEADIIDVYEAMDMFLPGMFAYRSVLQGGVPLEVPNLRDKTVRDQYREDTMCTDPKVAGDMLIPVFSKGNPDIPDVVYENMKRLWDKKAAEQEAQIAQKTAKREYGDMWKDWVKKDEK
ncbi:MAG: Gfo/Idh/MocA family oxidoreductase [Clostridia bacterium]|nr:Gfo/Idh/MocA family oxidoreductase [Clostridia bacterium]